jgi:hypothetical protein
MLRVFITIRAGATISRAHPTALFWLNTHQLAVPYATVATKWIGDTPADTVYEFTWMGQPWIAGIADVTEGIVGSTPAA